MLFFFLTQFLGSDLLAFKIVSKVEVKCKFLQNRKSWVVNQYFEILPKQVHILSKGISCCLKVLQFFGTSFHLQV